MSTAVRLRDGPPWRPRRADPGRRGRSRGSSSCVRSAEGFTTPSTHIAGHDGNAGSIEANSCHHSAADSRSLESGLESDAGQNSRQLSNPFVLVREEKTLEEDLVGSSISLVDRFASLSCIRLE